MSDQPTPKPKKLFDRLRDAIRIKHYVCNTDQAYVLRDKKISTSIG